MDLFSLISTIVPRPAKARVVGIDITPSAVKAVILNRKANQMRCEQSVMEPIAQGNVAASLSKIFSKVNITKYAPVTAVSGKGTLIRFIDMPRMSLEELRKSFVYEIDKHFPFEPNSVYFDVHIMDPQSKEKKMSVLAVAVKKEIVDERIRVFKEAGCALKNVSVNAVAIMNAFESLKPKVNASGKAKAVVDIGTTLSHVIIFKDNVPRFNRDIFISNDDFIKRIAAAAGMDVAAAQQKKDFDRQIVTSSCESLINQLSEEVRLSLDYFSREKSTQVDEVFISGWPVVAGCIKDALTAQLTGIAVVPWDPSEGLNITETQLLNTPLVPLVGLALSDA